MWKRRTGKISQSEHNRLIARESKIRYLYYCDYCKVEYLPLFKQRFFTPSNVKEVLENSFYSKKLRDKLIYNYDQRVDCVYINLCNCSRKPSWYEESI